MIATNNQNLQIKEKEFKKLKEFLSTLKSIQQKVKLLNIRGQELISDLSSH